ncbi:hypothetical protein Pyn_18470 [Prunus yedoensis var. nudiflora]|uniref:Uncharacterized protein n=1 Tax=Prunus yedoensis var. nudiflora TaxID=2094558 RepID=A0A314YMS1_PRUYE|nr:hypothetical protein Pyn_18470 [Prunus yedoensis var. nudiflora]
MCSLFNGKNNGFAKASRVFLQDLVLLENGDLTHKQMELVSIGEDGSLVPSRVAIYVGVFFFQQPDEWGLGRCKGRVEKVAPVSEFEDQAPREF